jgi:hypothetical protein
MAVTAQSIDSVNSIKAMTKKYWRVRDAYDDS